MIDSTLLNNLRRYGKFWSVQISFVVWEGDAKINQWGGGSGQKNLRKNQQRWEEVQKITMGGGKPPFFAPFTGRGTRPPRPRPPAPSRPTDVAQASASRIKNARQRRGKGRSYTCHKKGSLFTAPSMYCFLCLEIDYHPWVKVRLMWLSDFSENQLFVF